MLHPLFLYGTLHPDRAPAEIAQTARLLKPLGRATIHGRLYNLGDYPGVVLGRSGEGHVISGELFSLPEDHDADTVLARLDVYEDFRRADPASSLFLRQLTTAMLQDGTGITCWVYTYNRPMP